MVPVVHVGPGIDSVLILSAPGAAARVSVAVTPPRGATTTRILAVAGGQSVAQSLAAWKVPDGSLLTLTPAAGGGPLYVARLIEQSAPSGPLLSAYQVVGSLLLQPIPAVIPLSLRQP